MPDISDERTVYRSRLAAIKEKYLHTHDRSKRYGKDVRETVLAAINSGIPVFEAAEFCGISDRTIYRWLGPEIRSTTPPIATDLQLIQVEPLGGIGKIAQELQVLHASRTGVEIKAGELIIHISLVKEEGS